MTAKISIATALLCAAGLANAQQTTPQTQTTERVRGATQVQTLEMTGEVVRAQGNSLLARMKPLGNLSLFNVPATREFMIDGQVKHTWELQPGTILTGKITTKTTPVTVRTISTLSGTVWWAQNDYVVLTLANGENKGYKVPPAYKFVVNGTPTTVEDLRAGMKVTATKIVEEPQTEITTDAVVTGKAPKKPS